MDDSTPRLFRLPDLNPAAPAVQAVPEASISQASTSAASPALAYQAANDLDEASRNPGAPSHQAPVSAELDSQRVERHLDATPAGRNWLESAVAHRKVLVLLIVAVGAALWTARGRSDLSPADSSIADSSMADSSLAAGDVAANFDSQQIDVGQIEPAPIDPATVDSVQPIATPSVSSLAATAISLEASVSVESSPTNVPRGADVPPSIASMEIPERQSNTSINALSVSSRTPHNPGIEAPSLEDLQDAAEAAASHLTRQASAITVHNSNTPRGVHNWLEYLPPVSE